MAGGVPPSAAPHHPWVNLDLGVPPSTAPHYPWMNLDLGVPSTAPHYPWVNLDLGESRSGCSSINCSTLSMGESRSECSVLSERIAPAAPDCKRRSTHLGGRPGPFCLPPYQ